MGSCVCCSHQQISTLLGMSCEHDASTTWKAELAIDWQRSRFLAFSICDNNNGIVVHSTRM